MEESWNPQMITSLAEHDQEGAVTTEKSKNQSKCKDSWLQDRASQVAQW